MRSRKVGLGTQSVAVPSELILFQLEAWQWDCFLALAFASAFAGEGGSIR